MVGVVQNPFPVGQLGQRDRLAIRERIVSRNDDDELLPRDDLERAVPGGERQRADREIGDALHDRLFQLPAVPELMQADRNTRVALLPDPDVARQQTNRHRQHRGQLELARLELEGRPGALAAASDGAQRGPGLWQQGAAGRRERDAARQTVENGALELVLERPDVLRERRLGDPEPAGSTRERSLLDHGHEALELAKIHS